MDVKRQVLASDSRLGWLSKTDTRSVSLWVDIAIERKTFCDDDEDESPETYHNLVIRPTCNSDDEFAFDKIEVPLDGGTARDLAKGLKRIVSQDARSRNT